MSSLSDEGQIVFVRSCAQVSGNLVRRWVRGHRPSTSIDFASGGGLRGVLNIDEKSTAYLEASDLIVAMSYPKHFVIDEIKTD
jgi:hypothetical protein